MANVKFEANDQFLGVNELRRLFDYNAKGHSNRIDLSMINTFWCG